MSSCPKPPGPCPFFLTKYKSQWWKQTKHEKCSYTHTQLYLGKTTYLIQWIVIISYSGESPIQPPFWLWIVVEWSGDTVMNRRMINVLLWISIWCLRVSIVIPWRRRTTRSIRWNMPSFRDFRTLTSHDRLL